MAQDRKDFYSLTKQDHVDILIHFETIRLTAVQIKYNRRCTIYCHVSTAIDLGVVFTSFLHYWNLRVQNEMLKQFQNKQDAAECCKCKPQIWMYANNPFIRRFQLISYSKSLADRDFRQNKKRKRKKGINFFF